MKKLLALAMVLCMLCSSTAFATAPDVHDSSATSNTISLEINGESVNYSFEKTNGMVSKVVFREGTVERVGDEIYFNGEKVATVSSQLVYSNSVNTRSMSYIDYCPYGAREDYTNLVQTYTRNLIFTNYIIKLSVQSVVAVIFASFPIPNVALNTMAAGIIEYIIDKNLNFVDEIYVVEERYGHNVVGHSFRLCKFNSYVESANGNLIPDAYAECYGFWN